jgi:hypothetical protein
VASLKKENFELKQQLKQKGEARAHKSVKRALARLRQEYGWEKGVPRRAGTI